MTLLTFQSGDNLTGWEGLSWQHPFERQPNSPL